MGRTAYLYLKRRCSALCKTVPDAKNGPAFTYFWTFQKSPYVRKIIIERQIAFDYILSFYIFRYFLLFFLPTLHHINHQQSLCTILALHHYCKPQFTTPKTHIHPPTNPLLHHKIFKKHTFNAVLLFTYRHRDCILASQGSARIPSRYFMHFATHYSPQNADNLSQILCKIPDYTTFLPPFCSFYVDFRPKIAKSTAPTPLQASQMSSQYR